jgi:hypothetical protein
MVDVCADPHSEECMQFTLEYCASHPMDEACQFLAFFFERSVRKESSFHVHYGGAAVKPSVRFVLDSCLCGDKACVSEEVQVISTSFEDSSLGVTFKPLTVGIYKLCLADTPSADIGSYTTHLATMEALPGACAFDASTVSPCTADVCVGEGALSEECMYLVAEYCADHANDQGCAFVVPMFSRTVDEATSINLHYADLSGALDVKFVPEDCECDGACYANEVDVLAVSYDSSFGIAKVEFTPRMEKTYKMCYAPEGSAYGFSVWAATVQMVHTGCWFHTDEASPCMVDVCADPHSEACMQFTLEYCASHPMDEACQFLIYDFERQAGMRQSISVHVPSLEYRRIILIPVGCTGQDCAAREVIVHGSEYDSDTSTLSVTFEGSLSSTRYYVCSSANGKSCDRTIASVYLIGDCRFMGVAETPCQAEVCGSAYDEETCMQVMMAYCAEHPEDTGCAFLTPHFERTVKEITDVQLHVAVEGVASAFFVPTDCSCSGSCGFTEVDVLSTSFDAGHLTVQFQPLTEGEYLLCVEDSHPARKVASVSAGLGACLFVGGPCEDDACDDPFSEACMQVTAAYCAENYEPACEFLIYHFNRLALQPASVEFIVPARKLRMLATVEGTAHQYAVPEVNATDASNVTVVDVTFTASEYENLQNLALVTKPFFVSDSCECDHLCSAPVEVTKFELDIETATLHVDFTGRAIGTYRLCLAEHVDAVIASVSFETRCVFESGADAPCQMPECEVDPLGEACQLVMAEYCMHTSDTACALLRLHFVREAGVPAEISFHAVMPSHLDLWLLPEGCECGSHAPTCGERVLSSSYDRLTGALDLQVEPSYVGLYKVCRMAETGVPAEVVSTVQTFPGLAGFDADFAPCRTDCAETDDDACQQAIAEYCAHKPEDTGCAFVRPVFARTVKEASVVMLHVNAVVGASVRLVRSDCSCGEDCKSSSASLLSYQFDTVVGSLKLEVMMLSTDTSKICVADSLSTQHVGNVRGLPGAGCAYSPGERSPCYAEECVGPTANSEDCMQVTAEYCAFFGATDEGCAFIQVVFERAVGEVSELGLQTGIVGPLSIASVVPKGLPCQTISDVEVLSASLVVGNLYLEFNVLQVGSFEVCVNDQVVAALETTTPACPFDSAESPCSVPACNVENPGADAECMQFVAEYCAHRPDDRGCEFFVPNFELMAHTETRVSLHANVPAGSSVYVGQGIFHGHRSAAWTSEACTTQATEISVRAIEGNAVEGSGKDLFLTIELSGMSIGQYVLCANGDAIAQLRVHESTICAFGTATAPCSDPVCEDPNSDLCVQTIAQYCANFPEDTGCALVIPVFKRNAASLTKFSVHSDGREDATAYFVASGAGCSELLETTSVETLSSGMSAGLLKIDFLPIREGQYDLCMGRTLLAGLVVEPLYDDCLFQSGTTPCLDPACRDGDGVSATETCMQTVAEYCAYSSDTACEFFIPKFHRLPGISTISLHAMESLKALMLQGKSVGVTDGGCGCDVTCARRPVLSQNIVAEALTVDVDLRQGVYGLCIGDLLLARVEATDSGCRFAYSQASPCSAEVCAGGNTELCMQFTAQYCANFPEDEGCALMAPIFRATMNVQKKISIATSELDAFFAAAECGENAEQAADVEIMSIGRAGGFLTLEVLPKRLGVVQLCSASTGAMILELHIDYDKDCVFSTDLSPCSSPLCEDPTSEVCMQAVALYCAENREDEGCELVKFVFQRFEAELSVVSVLAPGYSSAPAAAILPSECECGEPCITNGHEVDVVDVVYGGSDLNIQVMPNRVGKFKICVSPYGFALESSYSTYIGDLVVVARTACAFDATAGSPCAADVCQEGGDSEICMQVASEYCRDFPSDEGCALMVPSFARNVGERTELGLHTQITPTAVRFVPATCGCDSECDETVALYSMSYEIGYLQVDFTPVAQGPMHVCVLRAALPAVHIATVVAEFCEVCSLFDTTATPCSMPACNDPTSQACVQAMAEYCAHSSDEACALLLPTFERVAGAASTVSILHTGLGSKPAVKIVLGTCSCDEECSQTEVLVMDVLYTGIRLNVDLQPQRRGLYKLCSSGDDGAAHLANLIVVPDTKCVFDTSDRSPCMVDVCEDSESEACMQYTAEYCSTFPDEACALFVPRFTRTVSEHSELALHHPGLTAVSDVVLIDAACSCGDECSSLDLQVGMFTYSNSGASMQVYAEAEQSAKICASPIGKGALAEYTMLVANVDFLTPADRCTFDAESTPCTADACSDPMSEACMQVISE